MILIDGKAGNEVGALMRRGLIAVGGASGDFPGVSLIAGSIFLFGPPGARPGAGMKRGTLAYAGPRPEVLGTFRYACTYRPVFLDLFLRQLRAWGFRVDERFLGGRWLRYCGDRVELGKGELLVWEV
jgi:formylmethanofuran dehydrogenase subunit C